MRLRQFVEEARRDARRPRAVDAPVRGEIDLRAAPRAREPDMGEAALLFEPGAALIVERALVRQQAFLPAGQEHGVELEPLGGMQRHDRDRFGALAAVGVHHQRDVLEEAAEVLELLHRAHELLQVFEPAGGVGRAVLLPHLGVAGLVEHDLGELGVRQRVLLRAPAVERRDQIAQRGARLAPSAPRSRRAARAASSSGTPRAPRMILQRLQRGVAEAALRRVDDALEGEIVGRLVDAGADRRARRGSRRARRSAGRR